MKNSFPSKEHISFLLKAILRLQMAMDAEKPKDGEVFFRRPKGGGGPIPMKNGSPQGVVGEKIKSQKSKPTALPQSFSKSHKEYIAEAGGDAAKGCQRFYAGELLGHYAKAEVLPGTKARVRFTDAGMGKVHDIVSRSPELAEVVEMLPDIIQTGVRLNDKPAESYHRDSKTGRLLSRHHSYVYFSKKVTFSDGIERNVIVDVGFTKQNYYEQYSFIAKGSIGYEQKKAELRDKYNIIVKDAKAPLSMRPFHSVEVGTSHGSPLPEYRCQLQTGRETISTPQSSLLTYDCQIVNIRVE